MITTADRKELVKIIRESPLDDQGKEALLSVLINASEEDFAAEFDNVLAEHVRRQAPAVERAVVELAELLSAEDSKYEAALNALETDLNRKLDKTDLNDIIRRQKFRDEYYAAFAKLQTERERAVRDIVAKNNLLKSS